MRVVKFLYLLVLKRIHISAIPSSTRVRVVGIVTLPAAINSLARALVFDFFRKCRDMAKLPYHVISPGNPIQRGRVKVGEKIWHRIVVMFKIIFFSEMVKLSDKLFHMCVYIVKTT